MNNQKIEAHLITKPIQLMAVWFIALVVLDSAFLSTACLISEPTWIRPTIVIFAILFVPIFIVGIFLMQTVFRKELQDDKYYSEYLKRNEVFRNFRPENPPLSVIAKSLAIRQESFCENDLESLRVAKYQEQQGLFLVHTWRPSITPRQVADIIIWLHQHGNGPLLKGEVEKVEYEFGRKFFSEPQVKRNSKEFFRIEVSAYGPMLCLARVFLKGQKEPLILERYVNFEEDSA